MNNKKVFRGLSVFLWLLILNETLSPIFIFHRFHIPIASTHPAKILWKSRLNRPPITQFTYIFWNQIRLQRPFLCVCIEQGSSNGQNCVSRWYGYIWIACPPVCRASFIFALFLWFSHFVAFFLCFSLSLSLSIYIYIYIVDMHETYLRMAQSNKCGSLNRYSSSHVNEIQLKSFVENVRNHSYLHILVSKKFYSFIRFGLVYLFKGMSTLHRLFILKWVNALLLFELFIFPTFHCNYFSVLFFKNFL